MTLPNNLNYDNSFYINYRFGLNESRTWYFRKIYDNGKYGYFYIYDDAEDFRPIRITKERFKECQKHAGETISTRI